MEEHRHTPLYCVSQMFCFYELEARPPQAKRWPRALPRHSLHCSGLGPSLPQLRGVPGQGDMQSGWDETMEAMWQSGTLKTWDATTCFICSHSQGVSTTGKKSLNHETKI